MSLTDAAQDQPRDLPALIDRARFRLEKARTSAEALEVRGIVTAALHHAKLLKASNQVQADCLRIIDRAEKLIGEKLIEQGVHPGGRPRKNRSAFTTGFRDGPPRLSDLEITRDQSAAWQRRAQTPDEVVEKAISDELDIGKAPTKTTIQKAVKAHHRKEKTGARFWPKRTKKDYITEGGWLCELNDDWVHELPEEPPAEIAGEPRIWCDLNAGCIKIEIPLDYFPFRDPRLLLRLTKLKPPKDED
jgi:hypothetical protein